MTSLGLWRWRKWVMNLTVGAKRIDMYTNLWLKTSGERKKHVMFFNPLGVPWMTPQLPVKIKHLLETGRPYYIVTRRQARCTHAREICWWGSKKLRLMSSIDNYVMRGWTSYSRATVPNEHNMCLLSSENPFVKARPNYVNPKIRLWPSNT